MNHSNNTKLHCPSTIIQNVESQQCKRHGKSCNPIGLMKVLLQGEADIGNEKVKSQQDVFEEIENTLKEKLK